VDYYNITIKGENMKLIDNLLKQGKKDFIIIEPREMFDDAIVGYNEIQNRLIYLHSTICNRIADEYQNENNYNLEESWEMAVDWIECNILAFAPDIGPIILFERENGEMVEYDTLLQEIENIRE